MPVKVKFPYGDSDPLIRQYVQRTASVSFSGKCWHAATATQSQAHSGEERPARQQPIGPFRRRAPIISRAHAVTVTLLPYSQKPMVENTTKGDSVHQFKLAHLHEEHISSLEALNAATVQLLGL